MRSPTPATGYWPDAIRLLVQFVAFSMATLAVRTLRERARASGELTDPPGKLFRWLVIRLGALQAAGFIVMEVTERLAAGDPIRASLTPRLLLVGIEVDFPRRGCDYVDPDRHLAGGRAPHHPGACSLRTRVHTHDVVRADPHPGPAGATPGAWGTRGPPATLLDSFSRRRGRGRAGDRRRPLCARRPQVEETPNMAKRANEQRPEERPATPNQTRTRVAGKARQAAAQQRRRRTRSAGIAAAVAVLAVVTVLANLLAHEIRGDPAGRGRRGRHRGRDPSTCPSRP